MRGGEKPSPVTGSGAGGGGAARWGFRAAQATAVV